MYVCICNGISDKEIRSAVTAGAGSLHELRDKLGVASQCGRCADHAMRIIEESGPTPQVDDSLFYALA